MKEIIDRQSSNRVFNFYVNPLPRSNLEIYFKYLEENPPKYALIGEAPGYKGCALTGIPFTSEYIIQTSKNAFFINNKNDLKLEGSQKENTAKYIWEFFPDNDVPLLWNAFPYHPHNTGNRESNRKPNLEEIKEGTEILEFLLKKFRPTHIIAVGNSARNAFARFLPGYQPESVRHPSFGGVAIFREKMKVIKEI